MRDPHVRGLVGEARHVAYGALPDHYPVVGATLVASLAAVAGDEWKDE